jgi:hypothetical protein
VDFDRKVIIVRQTKGNKDRVVMLPRSNVWEKDRQTGQTGVEVPKALEVKYPKVGQS